MFFWARGGRRNPFRHWLAPKESDFGQSTSTMLRMVPLPALTRRGGGCGAGFFPPPCSVSETGEGDRAIGRPEGRPSFDGLRRGGGGAPRGGLAVNFFPFIP